MMGTIVYDIVKTSFQVIIPNPDAIIKGGFIRWVGQNDTVQMTAVLSTEHNSTSTTQSFHWTCSAMMKKHIPCFTKQPLYFSDTELSNFTFSTGLIDQRLLAVIMNVTITGDKQAVASQVLEMTDRLHSLLVTIECSECEDHHVNQHERLFLKASCNNCDTTDVEFDWKIWLIQDGKHNLHFSHYKCVQADGSTFYILAPNSTSETPLNTTASSWSNKLFLSTSSQEFDERNILPDDELPPFPKLPGFPEEHQNQDILEVNNPRQARNAQPPPPSEHLPGDFILQQFPVEGEALYEDNFTLPDVFTMQELFPPAPLPYPLHPHYGPDYPITEEGLPGESGSAAARDQSLQRLGIFLTENTHDDHIMEGAGKGRKDSTNDFPPLVDSNDPYDEKGDPVRDGRIIIKPAVPHLAKRPRLFVSLDPKSTTTGFNSQYLVLKPGVLRVGSTYMIQVTVTEQGDHAIQGTSMEYIKVDVGPMNGRCTLMPMKGYSLDFTFRLHCLEWQSEHPPLFYELSYSLSLNDSSHLIYFGLNRNVKFVLPPGLPKDNYNVYLNVVVRDSQGAATKVCSLICQVYPLDTNKSLEQYIYNETYHSKSLLNKMIGEKQNQAILQRIHVFTTTLSMMSLPQNKLENIPLNSEKLERRESTALKFLDVIDSLVFYSKAEAVQALSALEAIVSIDDNVKPFALQQSLKIFLKLYSNRTHFGGTYPTEAYRMEIISFLAKLNHVANVLIIKGNDELLEILDVLKNILHAEMKEILKGRLVGEEPYLVEVPHFTSYAWHLTERKSPSISITIATRNGRVVFPSSMYSSLEQVHNASTKKFTRCEFEEHNSFKKCTAVIVNEYDQAPLINFDHMNKYSLLPSSRQIFTIKFLTCGTYEDILMEILPSNAALTIRFPREDFLRTNKTAVLMKKNMNVYIFNITQENVHRSLLFYIELLPVKDARQPFPLEVLFSYEDPPTAKKFILRKQLATNTKVLNFFVPENIIKEPGLYYFGIVSTDYDQDYRYKDAAEEQEYLFFAWKQFCVQKMKDVWLTQGCVVTHKTDFQSLYCRCQSLIGISSFSMPIESEMYDVPASHLVEVFFNPAPAIFLCVMFILYVFLLVPTYYSDKNTHISLLPIPLKDNNEGKHQSYMITIKTGSYHFAGTTASVFIVLHGQEEMTETRQLIGHNGKHYFHRGSVVTFLLKTSKSLGSLIKIEIWHNNTGSSPSWYLKDITVEDCSTGSNYYFECFNWLSASKFDCLIEREISVSDSPMLFKKVLKENFITSLSEINLWNSILCDFPTTTFTGIQRLTCSFCFILSSAAILCLIQVYLFTEQVEDQTIPHLSVKPMIFGCAVSILCSVLQQLTALCLRFSKAPQLNIIHTIQSSFAAWSWDSVYCWLQGKYSTHSITTSQSPSVLDESESFSYSHSSLSESGVLEECSSQNKDVFINSCPPSPDIRETASPLQKALSIWQAFELWARTKQGEVWCQENDIKKNFATENYHVQSQLLLSSTLQLKMTPFNSLDDVKSKISVNSHNSLCSITSGNSEDGSRVLSLNSPDHCRNSITQHTAFIQPKSILLSFFYFVGWLLLMIEIILSVHFIVSIASKFGTSQSVHWFQAILTCILCSCFIIHPFMALAAALMLSIKSHYFNQRISLHTTFEIPDYSFNENCDEDNGQLRKLYFKNYLRPPQEFVLLESRKHTLKEKFICSLLSDAFLSIAVLVLLVLMVYPSDNYFNYYQKTSIENALNRSSRPLFKLKTSDELWNWMQLDFLNVYHGSDQCRSTNYNYKECGAVTLTGCVPIGDAIIRRFPGASELCSETTRHHRFPKCHRVSLSNVTRTVPNTKMLEYFNHYQQRSPLYGLQDIYQYHDELVILNGSRSEAYSQLRHLSSSRWINNSTKAISIEFLLFNPTFSIFTSVALLAEFSGFGSMHVLSIILPFKLHHWTGFWSYFIFSCQLVLMVVTIIDVKCQLWKMLKSRKSFWNSPWNCFKVLYLSISVGYVVFYIYHFITVNDAILKLKDTRMEINFDFRHLGYLEKALKNALGLLLFFHLIGCLRLLQCNSLLFSFVENLNNVWKQLISCVVLCSFLVLNCGYLKSVITNHKKVSSFPLLQCMKGINMLLKDYTKPEISENSNPFDVILFGLFIFFAFVVNFAIITMVKAILISSRKHIEKRHGKLMSLKEASSMIKNRILGHFKPTFTEVFSTGTPTLPMEFLLLELEILVEKLVIKVNDLFTEMHSSNSNESLSEGSIDTRKPHLLQSELCHDVSYKSVPSNSFTEDVADISSLAANSESSESPCTSTSQSYHHKTPTLKKKIFVHRKKKGISSINKRKLFATYLKSKNSKPYNQVQISSLTSSLPSKRKSLKTVTVKTYSLTPQPCHIRKTYPVCQRGSFSSSDHIPLPNDIGDAATILTIRKTKSRGKGKHQDLTLDTLQ